MEDLRIQPGPPKGYCKRTGQPRLNLRFHANEEAQLHLARLQAFYKEHLGRTVSQSLLIRRALEGLVDYVESLEGQQAIQDECMLIVSKMA